MAYSHSQRRDIRLLALFRGASYMGDAVALVALFLRLAPLGHAWAVAGLAIAGALPLVLFAALAGRVIDRVPAKRFLALTCVAESGVCVAIGFWHGEAATLALMFTLSSFVAFTMPGYSALMPSIAGNENTERSQGLMQSVQGVAQVAGPALGGLLVGWSGQSWPLYIDAMSFAVCALGTTMLHHDRRPSPASTIERIESEQPTGGVAFVMRDDILRPVLIATMVFMLSLGMINVAEVFFATRTLHASALGFGLISTCFGAGTILGAFASGRLRLGQVQLAEYVLVSILAVGVLFGIGGLVTRMAYLYPLLLLAGVAVGVANVTYSTLFIRRTPEAMRGRMFAASGAMFTSSQVGAMALGGLFLTIVAPRTVFQIAGIASTLSTVVLAPLALRAARVAHERELDL